MKQELVETYARTLYQQMGARAFKYVAEQLDDPVRSNSLTQKEWSSIAIELKNMTRVRHR